MNIVHVTHEAVQKFGGIGAVLEGLITSRPYDEAVDRTILLCPLFTTEGGVETRLGAQGEVLYSSLDGRTNHPLGEAFRTIQQRYHIEIVYGRRMMRDPYSGRVEHPEVVLIDVGRIAAGPLNALKGRLFEAFGIASTRYEHSWDYEQYVRLAEPGLAVVRALGAAGGHGPCVIVAHEYMGLPTALAAKLHPECDFKTVFYAHEVSTVRRLVEEHEGHDTMFYNVLGRAKAEGRFLPDVFGDQTDYYRHALVLASRHLDVTLAVGDWIEPELRFLSADMAASNVRIAYNGIPSHEAPMEQAAASKARLQDYVETLLGHQPDFIFTHVTRLVPSKGLWRDLEVMRFVDEAFRNTGETAVLIVLSTEIGGPRRSEDIHKMEKWWDWPVAHREGAPDLTGGEALYYAGVQAFNARGRHCKAIYVNQFGFDREHCGRRMPKDMRFWDIREGSDVEFGQSIYEPFGIAQLEALSFGALCVMSSSCGCAGFVHRTTAGKGSPNVIIADYIAYRADPDRIESYLALKRREREAYELQVAREAAGELLRRLPRNAADKAGFVRRGYELAKQMSWDSVVEKYFLPALLEVCSKRGATGAA